MAVVVEPEKATKCEKDLLAKSPPGQNVVAETTGAVTTHRIE